MQEQIKGIEQNNGYKIPQFGFGVYMIRNHDICKKSVLTALGNGYRHIDTAQLYKNEKAVGEAIKESGIPREEIYLTTKIWTTNFGHEKASKAISKSIEALGVEYIDLLLLHQQFEDYIGAWKALEEAVDTGLVRSIGISNFNMKRTQEILDIARIKPVINQIEVHPYYQQNEMKEFLAKNSILTEVWYPLGHGDKKLLAEPLFVSLASKYKKSVAQVILRWHIQKGHIVFPKSTNKEHIKSNIDIFDFSLSNEDMAQIDAMDKNKSYFNMPEWLERFMYKFADKF